MRIAVLQRVCASYRTGLFSALARATGVSMKLFVGWNIPGTKVSGTDDFGSVPVVKLRTRFIRVGRRVLPYHVGLVCELRRFRPTVILCEGESHLLGYLQAMYYRRRYDRSVALIHWCYIALPGESPNARPLARAVKMYFRRCFEAFLVYSSFSKARLIEQGEDPCKVFVATNVGNVERHLEQSTSVRKTKEEARTALGLRPQQFTVLYVGTLSENKRPDVVLDLARACADDRYSFLIVGGGELDAQLRERVRCNGLSNVHFAGGVTESLKMYYRAADVVIVPGRGGIVISESMAFGLPVVVHQADGTEYDLVENEVTGIRVAGGSVEDFRRALEMLRRDPQRRAAMGATGRRLVEQGFNTDNMVRQILRAARYARAGR